MLGNVGCRINIINDKILVFDEQGAIVDYYIISDSQYQDLSNGIKSQELEDMKQRMNTSNSGYYEQCFLTESLVLKWLHNRMLKINNEVSLAYYEKYTTEIAQ